MYTVTKQHHREDGRTDGLVGRAGSQELDWIRAECFFYLHLQVGAALCTRQGKDNEDAGTEWNRGKVGEV